MPAFRISVDLGQIIPAGAAFNRSVFPALAHAVQRVADAAHQQWVAYASGAPMPNGNVISNRTGEYARSVQLRMTSDFAGEVYTDLAYARAIEEGSPARDMKRMLSSSLKVRTAKDGSRYLIIPFRFNTPNSVLGNAMPAALHDWWQQDRNASSIIGTYRRVSGTGAMDIKTRQLLTVPGWRYNWGTRLTIHDMEGLGIGGSAAKRMAGMVMFRKPRGVGGSSHSQYVNFRVMSEKAVGKWIVPAQPGKYPARTVTEQLLPVAEEAFKRAVEEDMARLLGGKVTG